MAVFRKHKNAVFLRYSLLTCVGVGVILFYILEKHEVLSPTRSLFQKVNTAYVENVLLEKSYTIPKIDKLPISARSKAILYLTENFKEVNGCRTCNRVQQKIPERVITFNIFDQLGVCNFLVFGAGFDSIMWNALNPGRTVFLEDNQEWIRKVKLSSNFLEVYKVDYTIGQSAYPSSLEQVKNENSCTAFARGAECFLFLDLPEEIKHMTWDVIMVDAPNGGEPTRQMSIYTASILARRNRKGTHVIVHDTHREIEQTFSDIFLCQNNLVESLERSGRIFSGSRLATRHYFISEEAGKKNFCF